MLLRLAKSILVNMLIQIVEPSGTTSNEPLDKSQDNNTIENPKVVKDVFYPNLNGMLVKRNDSAKDLRK